MKFPHCESQTTRKPYLDELHVSKAPGRLTTPVVESITRIGWWRLRGLLCWAFVVGSGVGVRRAVAFGTFLIFWHLGIWEPWSVASPMKRRKRIETMTTRREFSVTTQKSAKERDVNKSGEGSNWFDEIFCIFEKRCFVQLIWRKFETSLEDLGSFYFVKKSFQDGLWVFHNHCDLRFDLREVKNERKSYGRKIQK